MEIVRTAEDCVASLDRIKNGPLASHQQRNWAEDQLARFNVWADSLGVFAEERFSINHRLARNKQVSQLVQQLLEALSCNILAYHRIVANDLPPAVSKIKTAQDVGQGAGSANEELSDSELSDDAEEAPSPGKCTAKVEDGISRLLQLAVRVRQEGAKRSNEEVARFEPTDEHGKPLLDEFEAYIDKICQRAFEPSKEANGADHGQPEGVALGSVPNYLQERTKKTMLERWRRLCYRKHHASDLAGPRNKVLPKSDTQKQQTKPAAPPLVSRDSARGPNLSTKKTLGVDVAPKAMSTASQLPEHITIDRNIDPHPKTPPTVSTKIRADRLEFPRPPKIRDGMDMFNCNFCGLPCKTSLLEKRKWQDHVMQDLAPYFCVFEKCKVPHQTYRTSEEWLSHTRQEHARTSWKCQACRSAGASSRHSTFQDVGAYQQHIEQVHPFLEPAERTLVMTMSRHQEAPKFQSCCFCDFTPQNHLKDVEDAAGQKEITDHIAKRHLMVYALDSMPWDGEDGNNAFSGKASAISTTDIHGEDLKEQVMNDPELQLSRQYTQQETSPHAAALEEIRKRWDPTSKNKEHLRDRVSRWCRGLPDTKEEYTITECQKLASIDDLATQWASTPGLDRKGALEELLLPDLVTRKPVVMAQQERNEARVARKQSVVLSASMRPRGVDDDGSSDGTEASHPLSGLPELGKRFHELVRGGDQAGVSRLLSGNPHGLDVDCLDDKERTVVHIAVLEGHRVLLEDLITARCDLGYNSFDYGTPLFLAIVRGDLEAAGTLLKHGTDVNARISFRGSLLHVACLLRQKAMVELLLDNGANLEVYHSVYPHVALANSNNEFDNISFMVNPTSGLNSSSPFELLTSSLHGTPLTLAALFGHAEIVQLLIERGAAVDATSDWSGLPSAVSSMDVQCDGCTALILACRGGKVEVASRLLDAGADSEHEEENGDTPAINAVWAESLETLQLLMRQCSTAEERRKRFSASYLASASSGLAAFVRCLLDYGIPTDTTDEQGKTALILASLESHLEVVSMILDSGSDVNHTDTTGLTALMASAASPDAVIASALLACNADVHIRDEGGLDALMHAAYRNNLDQARVLLMHGARVETQDATGWTCVAFAASWDHDEMIRLLIESGASVASNTEPPLLLASRYGACKAIRVLLLAGAELEAKDAGGSTALFEACTYNEVEALSLLIEGGASLEGLDSEGNTALLKTVNAGHVECLQVLIEAGANPGASHRVWGLGLLLAAERGKLACLRLLLPKASPDVVNELGMTALMLAVEDGHKECARSLLEEKATVGLTDAAGLTALHYAAGGAHLECIRLLLNRRADHSARDKDGRTPLMLLATQLQDSNSPAECIRALLDAGASIHDTDDKGRSALWLSVHVGDVAVLKALCLCTGVDIDSYDEDGETVLMFAAQDSKGPKKLEALVNNGANIALQSPTTGCNALAYALAASNCPAGEILLKAGSDLRKVVNEIDSSRLLALKKGLNDLKICYYGVDCRDLVKERLREVEDRLEALRLARDPVVALKQHLKDRLVELAHAAKRNIRAQRRHKSVSFAPIETPEDRDDDNGEDDDDGGTSASTETSELDGASTLDAVSSSLTTEPFVSDAVVVISSDKA